MNKWVVNEELLLDLCVQQEDPLGAAVAIAVIYIARLPAVSL